jgi:hypothetical protein
MVEYLKNCAYCNIEFIAHRKDKKFCSSKCRDAHNYAKHKENEEYLQNKKEYSKQWYQNNKEYAKQRSSEYIKSHNEQRKQIRKKYFKTHKETALLQKEEYLRSQTKYEEYSDYIICHFGEVETIIDVEDLDRIKTQAWCAISNGYLCFKSHDFKYKLHRFIMQCYDTKLNVHHIDNNQTNNRKSNLIILTHSQHSRLHRHQDKLGRFLSRDEIIDFLSLTTK